MSEENKADEIPAESAQTNDEIHQLKAELEKSRRDFLYLAAEFDNYKKNAIRERSDLQKYGTERVFSELLEIVDNFERALSSDLKADNLDVFKKGTQLIYDELRSVMSRFGVQEVPALGAKFDPNVHSALSSEPTLKFPEGHISQVFKKPYKLHDKLIRPGQVVVAIPPANANENKDS